VSSFWRPWTHSTTSITFTIYKIIYNKDDWTGGMVMNMLNRRSLRDEQKHLFPAVKVKAS